MSPNLREEKIEIIKKDNYYLYLRNVSFQATSNELVKILSSQSLQDSQHTCDFKLKNTSNGIRIYQRTVDKQEFLQVLSEHNHCELQSFLTQHSKFKYLVMRKPLYLKEEGSICIVSLNKKEINDLEKKILFYYSN